MLLHYLVKPTLVWMWTLQQHCFTQQCKISTKHNEKGDKRLTKSRQSVSSKAVFEVSSLHTNTSSKSSVPLINSHVASQLFKAAPDFNRPLLQFVDGVDFPLVYTTLHDSPDLVINLIEIWTAWRPLIWRNEVFVFLDAEPLQYHACIHTGVSFTR